MRDKGEVTQAGKRERRVKETVGADQDTDGKRKKKCEKEREIWN